MNVSLMKFLVVASVATVVGYGHMQGACRVPPSVLEKLSFVDIDDLVTYAQDSLRASTDSQIKTVLIMSKYAHLLCCSTTAHAMAEAYQSMITTLQNSEVFGTEDEKTLAMFTFLEFYDVLNQLVAPLLKETATSFIETFKYHFKIQEPKKKHASTTVQYGWAKAEIMQRCDDVLSDLAISGGWTDLKKSGNSDETKKGFLQNLCCLS